MAKAVIRGTVIAPQIQARRTLSWSSRQYSWGVTVISRDNVEDRARTIGIPWELLLPVADALVDLAEQHEQRGLA